MSDSPYDLAARAARCRESTATKLGRVLRRDAEDLKRLEEYVYGLEKRVQELESRLDLLSAAGVNV